jgi:MFS family permease
MLIGVVATTFFALMIPLVQSAEQLIIVRLLTGFGAGFAVSAAFPIAAELMPAQHRRTYGAIYEMALAISFTVVPFIAYLLTGNSNAFRYLVLPGGLAITVVLRSHHSMGFRRRSGTAAVAFVGARRFP